MARTIALIAVFRHAELFLLNKLIIYVYFYKRTCW